MDVNGGSAATFSQATETQILLDEIEGLRDALRTRTLIGQAVGILMSEKCLTTDEAFAELVATSSHSNVKLRDVAARMVALAEAGVERRRHLTA
jgi:AmiR/NasT family two-component response regulator